jgi:hypothetical protein
MMEQPTYDKRNCLLINFADRVYLMDHGKQQIRQLQDPDIRISYQDILHKGDRYCSFYVDPANGKLYNLNDSSKPETALGVGFPQAALSRNAYDHGTEISIFNDSAQHFGAPCSLLNAYHQDRTMENILPRISFLGKAYEVNLLTRTFSGLDGAADIEIPLSVLCSRSTRELYFYPEAQRFLKLEDMDEKVAAKSQMVWMPPAEKLDPVGFNRLFQHDEGYKLLYHFYHAADELRHGPVDMDHFKKMKKLIADIPKAETRVNAFGLTPQHGYG